MKSQIANYAFIQNWRLQEWYLIPLLSALSLVPLTPQHPPLDLRVLCAPPPKPSTVTNRTYS